MDRIALGRLLDRVRRGEIDTETALEELSLLPYEDLGFAKVDHHRAVRLGMPEVVFCPGKTPEQVVEILKRLAGRYRAVMATRAGPDVWEAVRRWNPEAILHSTARIIVVRSPEHAEAPPPKTLGFVAVVSAGTADLPVAEEAAVTLEVAGDPVERVYDVGVAGLHRLLACVPLLRRARVVVAVAGMEGALPSVLAGLVGRPVIGVPSSAGYGASFGGLAALLAMVNSCAPGVTVVNIDNGFGAAVAAHFINRAPETDNQKCEEREG
ncbi:MAG: nickel pincer cofactor biosynthesis protein LarB [Ignavibacteriales bacterium]